MPVVNPSVDCSISSEATDSSAKMLKGKGGSAENGLLTERKPGTPTKRQSGNSNWGEENKTLLGNTGMKQAGGLGKPTTPLGQQQSSSSKAAQQQQAALQQSPALPERLQKRLATLPGRPSAEALLEREAAAESKRESLLQAKVAEGKCHDEQVEKVRERKREYAKNISMLGGCAPAGKRAVSPVALPKRLASKVEQRSAAREDKLATLEAKEAGAVQRRASLLASKVAAQQSHLLTVSDRLEAKTTAARFELGADSGWAGKALPPKLAARLAELRVPTAEALLRKEKLAASRRALFLEARAQAQRERAFARKEARAAKAAFVANEVEFVAATSSAQAAKLPKRLAQRLARLNAKWTPAASLAKEAAAESRRSELQAAAQAKQRAHLATVAERKALKMTQPRFAEGAGAKELPAKLKARLAALRKPTAEAILRKEKAVAQRGQIRVLATAHAARAHNFAEVDKVLVLKRSMAVNMQLATTSKAVVGAPQPHLPAHLRARLASLAAAKQAKAGKAALETKAAHAAAVRANKLEGVTAQCSEHNRRVACVQAAKQFEPRFCNNAGSSLPEALKDRLAGVTRRTPAAILRKNATAVARAKAATLATAAAARAHNARAAQAVQLKQSMVSVGLDLVSAAPRPLKVPKRLSQQLHKKVLQLPEALIAKEERASAKRAELLAAKAKRAAKHNAGPVAQRLAASSRQPRFDVDSAAVATLPANLQQRLAALSRPTDAALLRKQARALAKRELRLEAVRFEARAHSQHCAAVAELKADMDLNALDFAAASPAPAQGLPAALRAKLTPAARPTAEQLLAKEAGAAAKRAAKLAKEAARAKAHGATVAQRCAAKDSEPRFALSDAAKGFLPAKLQARLATLRRPTAEATLAKLHQAAQRAQLASAAVAHKARLHNEGAVPDVLRTRALYRDNMALLARGQTAAVKLPTKLAKRAAKLEASKPSAEKLLAKEASAAAKRAAMLAERSAKLAERAKKVKAVWEAKKTVPRFSEEEIADARLPAHLKERLRKLRAPTSETLANKQQRAQQRKRRSLEAKVDSAAKHAEYVAKVNKLKQEFEDNHVVFNADAKERAEAYSPSLPDGLKKRLDKRNEAHVRAPAKDILAKHTAVSNQRDALLQERVNKNKLHSDKVNKIRDEKKRSATN